MYDKALESLQTPIPGLTIWELPVHGDNRGWFKENWQRQKMVSAGLPDFRPVQNNISFNGSTGTTRGIHAEPWDKFVSVATGRVFGAWVDMRSGANFGRVFTAEIDPSRAVYVPRGVGNAYQTLMPDTAYTYLVNDYYSPGAEYPSINLADHTLGITWPISLELAELSDKDRRHPPLAALSPIAPRKTLVIGGTGQLGSALRMLDASADEFDFTSRSDLDLREVGLDRARIWKDYDTIINAAAFTAVDEAETPKGREAAWATNVSGVGALSRIAADHGITLVHISSDYVFDGAADRPYSEGDPVSPLGVYGQTKAAGDAAVTTIPRHYVLRTSWVIGDGGNFVRTMRSLAERGISPSVVTDQRGRLTFASELARAIRHLVRSEAPFGLYNMTGAGPVKSWHDIARDVFTLTGHNPDRVQPVTTEQYFASAANVVAPRPRNSALDLTKIRGQGFFPRNSTELLIEYLNA